MYIYIKGKPLVIDENRRRCSNTKENISNYLVHIQKLNGTETSTETY